MPPTNVRWIWPLYPLLQNAWESFEWDVGNALPGQTIHVAYAQGTLLTGVWAEVKLKPGEPKPSPHMLQMQARQCYIPTDSDLALLSRHYPGDDPNRPVWQRIKADLTLAGNDRAQLVKSEVPLLLAMLAKAAQAAPPENGNRRRNKCTTSLPKRGKRLSPTPRTAGYELFYSFSTKDESLRIQLETHLAMLKRENLIREWNFRKIVPGVAFKDEIDKHLNTANIILLLVSADFLASDYCYTIEMKRAMERHKKGSAVVIPIILRECDWQTAPFGDLEALPKDAKPVTSWRDKDKAFTDIAKGIRRTIESLKS